MVLKVLSNGAYSVRITSAGGGKSSWNDLDLTRWRDDRSTDAWGMFFYLKDLKTQSVWSAAEQPVRASPPDDIETRADCLVPKAAPVEIRRLMLTNRSGIPRDIEITSYLEVVLAPGIADLSHPAFSNLFVQTEYVRALRALLCFRRPRSSREKTFWMFHTVVGGGRVEYETDRARFIGRGRTVQFPRAMDNRQSLSNTVGAVLDPILSLRRRVRIPPGLTAEISFVTGAATSRSGALMLAGRYRT